MDPFLIFMLALAVSMTPCMWLYAVMCLVWGIRRARVVCTRACSGGGVRNIYA